MLTDENLTAQLRRAFDEATRDLTSRAGLGAEVRRRHRTARRRAGAARVALPVAAAACVGGVVMADGGRHRAHVPNAQGPAPSVSPIKPVSYRVTIPARAKSLPCLDGQRVPAPHDAATWVVATGPNDCLTIVVRTDVASPHTARPIDLAGVPGLYETKDAAAHTRTVYSRNPGGRSWSALTVAADTPDARLRSFYAPGD